MSSSSFRKAWLDLQEHQSKEQNLPSIVSLYPLEHRAILLKTIFKLRINAKSRKFKAYILSSLRINYADYVGFPPELLALVAYFGYVAVMKTFGD